LEVTGRRVVATVIEKLERIYGRPITYEDPVVENDRELEDVTEPKQRLADPDKHFFAQKERTVSFSYDIETPPQNDAPKGDARTEAAVSDALGGLLRAYTAAGGPEAFSVSEEDSVFHVIPKNYLNKNGEVADRSPLLDSRITIAPGKRTRRELFSAICGALSITTGLHVGEGSFPDLGDAEGKQTAISGSGVAARVLLSQLLKELANPPVEDYTFRGDNGETIARSRPLWKAGPMSWELLYAPGWGYDLNIYSLRSLPE
jgi:hypothetical protein